MRVVNNLGIAILKGWEYLSDFGKVVKAKHWQGVESPRPMFEALDYDFKCLMPYTEKDAVNLIKPNVHWANMHFEERVCGEPLNPPPSHEIWPFGDKGKFIKDKQFSHTYPERFWPKYAGVEPKRGFFTEDERKNTCNMGIRFDYGDFGDVLGKLLSDPLTRQAYLPIFFPEDTGIIGVRVPCTIGYLFTIRDNRLDITYWMRSLDMLRHFQDDIYLCFRLAKYVQQYLLHKDPVFKDLTMGYMKFHAVSCHIFDGEQKLLDNKIKQRQNDI